MSQDRPLIAGLEQEWRRENSHGKSALEGDVLKAERSLVLEGQN